jgi:menaquinone-dependent protoporphyrinogen oxidase
VRAIDGKLNTRRKNMRTLIAYGSFAGAAAEAAEFIGREFTAKGMTVDVVPVEKAGDISSYTAVVVGTAVRMGKIKPSVISFVRKNRKTLSHIPVAYFTVSLTVAVDTPQNKKIASDFLEPLRLLVKPVSEVNFAGKIVHKKLDFFARMLTMIPATKKALPEADYMKWEIIKQWSEQAYRALNK